MLKLLILLAMLPGLAAASVLDDAGPTDAGGRPQVDLYDAAGAQRGTPNNPLNVSTSVDPDTMWGPLNVTARDAASVTTANANGQNAISGTPTAGSAAVFPLASFATGMVIISGTWTGTMTVEVSSDNGATWQSRSLHIVGTSMLTNNFTANVVGSFNATAKGFVRIRSTGATHTGTAVVKIFASNNVSNIYVANGIKIIDGTATSAPSNMAVKAPSVPADTIDTAAVVTQRPYLSRVVTGNQTLTLKTGPGVLHMVVIGNASTGGAITVFDNTAASGTAIGYFAAGTPSGGLLSGSGNQPVASTGAMDAEFNTGLTVVTSGSANNAFTVVYQ